MSGVQVCGLEGIGEIQPGDDLARIAVEAMNRNDLQPMRGDVLVIAQKVVSKSEDRYMDLDSVTPSQRAQALAEQTRKDPRLVELVLSESSAVVRACPGVLIVRHRSGHVMANAGIDASNVIPSAAAKRVLLLPEDADASARKIQKALVQLTGAELGVIISDSFGRPWRNGVTNVAIGAAGLSALVDRRQEHDRYGRPMEVTQVGLGDLLASAAGLVMGEADEGLPIVHIRGLPARYTRRTADDSGASTLIRPLSEDLFR